MMSILLQFPTVKHVCKSLLQLNRHMIGKGYQGLQNPHLVEPLFPELSTIKSSVRYSSFFNKYSGDDLWKSVTSVSNQGRQKGRAARARKKIDYNRGQIVGRGVLQVNFPGLNEKVYDKPGHIAKIVVTEGEDTTRSERLKEAKERQMKAKFKKKVDPLDRGWAGTKWPGRSIGPPDPIHGEKFEGFDTIVLEQKRVHHMTHQGRVQRYSIFVVTGNKNGTVGFGLGKAMKIFEAMKIAKNNAGKHLMYIPRYNDHTVFHDFWTRFYNSKMMVRQQAEGHGLDCHRVVREICKVVGIRNLHCEVEGATKNSQNVTKAFILGLLRQKTHQQLADDKQLYLVEKKEECFDFPRVVATPTDGYVRMESEIPNEEELDYTQYTMNDKVALKRRHRIPGYVFSYGYNIYLKKLASLRNRETTRQQIIADHGSLENFYPIVYKDYVPELPKRE